MKNNLENRVKFLEVNLNATLDIILDLQKIISDLQDNMLEHAKITWKHVESISSIDDKMDDFDNYLLLVDNRLKNIEEKIKNETTK